MLALHCIVMSCPPKCLPLWCDLQKMNSENGSSLDVSPRTSILQEKTLGSPNGTPTKRQEGAGRVGFPCVPAPHPATGCTTSTSCDIGGIFSSYQRTRLAFVFLFQRQRRGEEAGRTENTSRCYYLTLVVPIVVLLYS